ncbi:MULTISPECIES: motility protein A [Hydrogenophaga]|uniref:Chemotaxis protein MotA n=1 Tax=Hydrogenophaga electricum TaxID=1230953 RepID=A0ABQ6C158_9BURK|nr:MULTISPECIES: MotA/TolQ/ExbB proton channel family protein [Hydrogenophaga]GLS12734.1 chemotaxis protein MotA [Hydrogenophaga electricum]
MNPSTLIGMIASVVLMAVILLFAVDDPLRFIDAPSIAIVLGGTLAATFLSYPLREVLRVFQLVGKVIRQERIDTKLHIEELVVISRLWMQGDLQAVERALAQIQNPFLRTGVQLVIDHTPEDEIIDLLQWRIAHMRSREAAEAQIFRLMATYAPAFGMLGTLLGLINLMELIGAGDMKAIGQQLAIALITTFYGILLANLVFKPIAVKLERRTEQRLVLMNMVLEGISLMHAGRSPALMRETLKAFVAQYDDEIYDGKPERPAKPSHGHR